jgi:hemophore-related protein
MTITTRRRAGGLLLGSLVAAAAATLTAPAAGAAPCSVAEATGTISSVSGAASAYLTAHPETDRVLSDARTQSPEQARATVRDYFMANPGQYLDLKNITAPLVDLQNRCGTAGLPGYLVEAFNEFQRG